eukprot:CAMPEP_0198659784 /NCGR_PEP_ID=MMETSP1467-20131203/33713_1 /TAXON_ID=1462469 /ORGANISM="unid. sp., Strain CCMP2135" /LENGTH=315 /DNA_ID=CAMNT_0044396163 /DNA_START=35 /DNA_END=982 /DNA_ORIENTATION=-
MISEERAERLYGKAITEADYVYFRMTQRFLVTLCAAGVVVQFLQLSPGPQAPLEMVCAFVYLAYNIFGMLIVRVSTVAFKFEDRTALWITVRMALAMALYGLVIFITIPTFRNSLALQLMGVFGVVNIIVILPTNIFENTHVLYARSHNVGLDKAVPLSGCANAFLMLFFGVAFLFLGGAIAVCLALLPTSDGSQLLWTLLTLFYVGLNVIPIVVPKIQHLVLTEVRTWPLKTLIAQYVTVLVAVILIGAVLSTVKTTRRLKIVFGILGVANGVVVSLALAFVSVRALVAPRTGGVTGTEVKGPQEEKQKDDLPL